MARYSARKIAVGLIKYNVNLWGGQNIPALQSLMSFAFEPKRFLEQYQVDSKDVRTTTQSVTDINKAHDEAIKEEEKLEQLRRGFAKHVLNMLTLELMITTIDNTSFLPRSVYNLSTSIINNNKLDKKLTPHVFYAIDVNTRVAPDILKKYAEGIMKLRRLEQDIRNQENRVRQKYNDVVRNMNKIKTDIKTKRKK